MVEKPPDQRVSPNGITPGQPALDPNNSIGPILPIPPPQAISGGSPRHWAAHTPGGVHHVGHHPRHPTHPGQLDEVLHPEVEVVVAVHAAVRPQGVQHWAAVLALGMGGGGLDDGPGGSGGGLIARLVTARQRCCSAWAKDDRFRFKIKLYFCMCGPSFSYPAGG